MLKLVFKDPYLPAALTTAVIAIGFVVIGFIIGYW
jgi:hypothetical protein